MAILFYEGLPGAGKSYEAMATQIIPFLQKGREVVAYIEGLDHERIAVAADMPVERVRAGVQHTVGEPLEEGRFGVVERA
jgi:zona occludens toxin